MTVEIKDRVYSYLSPSDRDWLSAYADKKGYTVSGLIRHIIREYRETDESLKLFGLNDSSDTDEILDMFEQVLEREE